MQIKKKEGKGRTEKNENKEISKERKEKREEIKNQIRKRGEGNRRVKYGIKKK